jgi:tetrahydromethanopterin S-methyltransferase subunit G
MSVPVFVKIDDYQKLTENVDKIKGKIALAKEKFETIKQIREEEDLLYNKWAENLQELEQKLDLVESKIPRV